MAGVLLAGPIVRRCEPSRVCVWLATSDPVEVGGAVVALERDDAPVVGTGAARQARLGPGLTVHLVTITPDSERFPTDELLGYDLEVDGRRLRDLDLVGGAPSIAYGGLPLPSFFLREHTPALRLLHGSCRLLHGKGDDAFRAADELIASTARDLHERPSVLMLTGDQIYGDEVAGPLIGHLTRLGTRLLGRADATSVPGMPPLTDIPVYGRQDLVSERAGFTSQKAGNHLLSAGEFAAMYLVAWNEANWPDRLPDPPADLTSKQARQYRDEAADLDETRASLPQVRRVLANVPTYTIFDDHDVTDDWNLTREWCQQVSGSPAGRRAIAAALGMFWAFQGWGNQPDLFDDRFVATIIDSLADLDGAGGDVFDRTLWGFDRWSYHVPTDPPAIALDTRTHRDFDSAAGAPRLMGASELGRVRQLASDAGVTPGVPAILVSAVPMYGLELQERRQKYLVGKVGPYEIDFEAWHSNLHGLLDTMHLLVDDLGLTDVVVLSGDVHYGINVAATFQIDGRPLRIAQVVSSSFKHSGIVSRLGLRALGYLVRPQHDRVGWSEPPHVAEGRVNLVDRVFNRAANTDEWQDDAPVFLAPRMAARIDPDQRPRYRESRRYLTPREPPRSVVVGRNNVGLLTVQGRAVSHRILGRPDGRTTTHTVGFRFPDPSQGDAARVPAGSRSGSG